MRIEFTPAIYVVYIALLFIVAFKNINSNAGLALFIAAINSVYFLLIIYNRRNHD